MTAQSDLQPYDFRSPSGLPDGVEQRLLDWHRGLCSVACENWAHFSRSPLTMEHGEQSTVAMYEARPQMPAAAIGCVCTLGAGKLSTLLVFPRQVILALVNDVLGETADQLPEDRELTAVEQSLCELWFEHFCQAVSESWPRQDALVCHIEGCDARPQRSRLFAPSEGVVLCGFKLTGSFGTNTFHWILPQQPIVELMSETNANGQTRSEASLQQLEARTMEIPAQLVVRLGQAQLEVADLARLSAGDVIILDQKITDPLAAAIAGEKVFQGWPGRVGSRQAFKIDRIY
jgi:flagellar motor switch protein FliM